MASGQKRGQNRRDSTGDQNTRPVDDDLMLFRQTMAGATPLRPQNKVVRQVDIPPVPVQSLLDTHQALAQGILGPTSSEQSMETGEELVYLRNGLSRDVLRKLRRGHWVAQDALDLHGLNREQAHTLIVDFFEECRRRHLRCVRIVHGKGLRSPNREPVLKGKLHQWLAKREEILAYCQAPANLGGSGALLVLLDA